MSNKTTLTIAARPTVIAKKGEVLADDNQAYALDRIATLKDSIEEMEDERKSLVSAVISSMPEGERVLRWSGGKCTVVTVDGRTSFDYQAFMLAHPELAGEMADYIKKSEPYSFVRLGR